MRQAAAASQFPSLFSHQKRSEWGVGVLSGERDGKRSYLFEDGEERVLGAGGIELMRRVERPDRDQQATCAHLMSLLAKRKTGSEPAEAAGSSSVLKQLERFHKKYHGGFFGKSWREEDKNAFVRQTRSSTAAKVREQLSLENLEKLLKAQRFDAVWSQALALLAESKLTTGKLRIAAGTDQQQLAEVTLALLHGSDGYERRFDNFVSAFEVVFKEAPSWQTATALPALMSPEAHVYVEPTSFRKQLKALSRQSAFPARPNGAAYTRCLGMAQALANMLAARGEVPRDLLDVHDFVRVTV